MMYIITQKINGMSSRDNLFLKKSPKESFLLINNVPLSITNIGIEKSLKQSRNAEMQNVGLFTPANTNATEAWQKTMPIIAIALSTS